MIKDTNIRIQITLSKAQANWLKNLCKKAGISTSKYISWILSKKADELLNLLNLNTHFGNYTKEQIEEIMKTNLWIED